MDVPHFDWARRMSGTEYLVNILESVADDGDAAVEQPNLLGALWFKCQCVTDVSFVPS